MSKSKWPFDSRLRGPAGRPICCWCGKEVPKGRQSWCGDACVHDYKSKHDWAYIRDQVWKRDRGICALCGLDTMRLFRIVAHVRKQTKPYWPVKAFQYQWGVHFDLLHELGFDSANRDPWDMDHIKPRVEGGGHEMTNLWTLCVPCHKSETAKLNRGRAKKAVAV